MSYKPTMLSFIFFSFISTSLALVCDRTDCTGRGTCIGGTKLVPLCICDLGYSGSRCETGANLLFPDPANTLPLTTLCGPSDCNGNGLCFGSKALPSCLCNLGYQGLRCEFEPLCISAIACFNNGFCLGTAKSFICLCNLGFTGPNCALLTGK